MDPSTLSTPSSLKENAGVGRGSLPPSSAPNVATQAPHLWDRAQAPEIAPTVDRFESAWRAAPKREKPRADDFLAQIDAAGNPALRLALLRCELALRWEAGETTSAIDLVKRLAPLDEDQFVALAYEEFCLREERDQRADAASFYARYPTIAARLRPLLEIHDLVGQASAPASLVSTPPNAAQFPDVGDEIGGFKLVGELGRGGFARVYLARESGLADRNVVLKLAPTGSREPQTLARLQHTHIVPIHSYFTDEKRQLSIICMPYFVGVTLSKLIAHPRLKEAHTGADLLGFLDELNKPRQPAELTPNPTNRTGRLEPPAQNRQAQPVSETVAARRRIAPLPYTRAIAQWGAWLAEALGYAHEHDVVHGDLKPSNVLITADGVPMLLDFNLAQSTAPNPPRQVTGGAGGTILYMAPEQLDALVVSDPLPCNVQSDIYAFGVLLYESMGARPFPKQKIHPSRSPADMLRAAAAERRKGPESIRRASGFVTSDFAAVVEKCLKPDPTERYSSAAQLAEDLQAVADDRPLRHAKIRQPLRTGRWIARNSRWLWACAAVAAVFLVAGIAAQRMHARNQLIQTNVRLLLADGRNAEQSGRPDHAVQFYLAAEKLAAGLRNPELSIEARHRRKSAALARTIRDNSDRLLDNSGAWRFRLMGFATDSLDRADPLFDLLAPFGVLSPAGPGDFRELGVLDDELSGRVVREIEELLFFWAIAAVAHPQASPALLNDVSQICSRAITFSESSEPWNALKSMAETRRDGNPVPRLPEPDPLAVDSAWACFQWGLIDGRLQRGRPRRALRWLNRSVALEPSQYWAHYFLGVLYEREAQSDRALAHYHAAVALDPTSPWAVLARARLSYPRNEWEQATLDLDRAIRLAATSRLPEAFHERGLVRQRLGDFRGAREDYNEVLRTEPTDSPLARSTRLNLAAIEAQEGRTGVALAEYSALLSLPIPAEERAALLVGRVRLGLRLSALDRAAADIAALERLNPESALVPSLKAELALAQNAPEQALAQAQRLLALDPSLNAERLVARAALAAGHPKLIALDDPDAVWRLPGSRAALTRDLQKMAGAYSESDSHNATRATLQAILLACLKDPKASHCADHALNLDPSSIRVYIAAARVHFVLGNHQTALKLIENGLEHDPVDPRLLELRAIIQLNQRNPRLALATIDHARRAGGTTPTLHATRARILSALGRFRESLNEWSSQLEKDPESPDWYIERARLARRLRIDDQALADLEIAASLADLGRADTFALIAAEYSLMLRARPDRATRALQLARRALELGVVDASQPPIKPRS